MPTADPAADAAVIEGFISHEQPMRMDERVANTLNALNALSVYLSAIPGRKSLIWFSSSFPISIGDSSNLDAARNYEGDLKKTADLLRLARVAVYPMDPGAESTPSQFSVMDRRGGEDLNEQASKAIDKNETADALADATGGRAFHSSTDLASAIGAVTQLSSNYYTVAYAPKDSAYDGKFRKLSIKVDAPKSRLDYRRGYYARDPDQSGIAALAHPGPTASVLLRGAPAATDILFKVRVAPTENAPQAPQPGVVRYSVNWSVDPRGLTLPASANGMRHGGLELAVVAYNKDAKAINSVSTPASLILQPEEYAGYIKTGLRFHQELDLPTGQVYLRVAIFDTSADHAGATEFPLNVQPATAQTSPTAH
jgi:hypothetical protein